MRTNITSAKRERLEDALRIEIDAHAQEGRTPPQIRESLLTAFRALTPRQAAAASRALDRLLPAERKSA